MNINKYPKILQEGVMKPLIKHQIQGHYDS